MDKINVVYWSQTGNTEAMAEAIGSGIKDAGKDAKVVEVGSAEIFELRDASVFALGCPAMGDEVLEETEFEPFIDEIEEFLPGKKVALFGSYGWGDGEWMKDWVDRMSNAGAKIINNEGLICQELPDDEAVAQCKKLGKLLAEAVS